MRRFSDRWVETATFRSLRDVNKLTTGYLSQNEEET